VCIYYSKHLPPRNEIPNILLVVAELLSPSQPLCTITHAAEHEGPVSELTHSTPVLRMNHLTCMSLLCQLEGSIYGEGSQLANRKRHKRSRFQHEKSMFRKSPCTVKWNKSIVRSMETCNFV
jgi:hypothetical protein